MAPSPPSYTGEQCRNAGNGGEHDLDIVRLGAYYGRGYRRVETGFWNNRPALWELI